MKHILSLDGGGIRGVFTLEILLRIQQLLREHAHNPQLMLADHFEFIAGTSTGAMIATALSWGMDAQTIMDVYEKHGKAMFQPVPWY
ncbi:MAG: patatin-like phospholipase family protein, partial [Candidatus Acidiferrales bacterium]